MGSPQRVIFRPLVLDPNNVTVDVSNGELYLELNAKGEFDFCYKSRIDGSIHRVASTGEEGVVTATDFARKLLSAISEGEFRQMLQLGRAATCQVGSEAGQVAAGDHQHASIKNLGIATTIETGRSVKADGMYSYAFNNFTTNRVGTMTYGQVLTVSGKYGTTDKDSGFQLFAGWGEDANKFGYRVLDLASNSWSELAFIYTTKNKPKPVDIGAVPRWVPDTASSGTLTAFSIWLAKPVNGGGSLKRNLPASPSEGDQIIVRDDSGIVTATQKITIGRNGRTIMGLTEDMDITTPYQSVTLIYKQGDWRVF